MRILNLDGGGIFGFAHGDPFSDEIPVSGSHRLPHVDTTEMMLSLENWLIGLIKGNGITDLYIEKSIIPDKTSYDAVMKLGGYNLVSGMAAKRCGLKCNLVDMQTWRSELGLPTQGPKNVLAHPEYAEFAKSSHGGLKKDALKQAKRKWVKDRAGDFARKMGCVPKDDNEADAICIYYFQRQRIRARADKKKYDLFEGLEI